MAKLVKTNEMGRRIGEDHPRAVLTDHEVGLLIDMLTEREAVIGRMQFDGVRRVEIDTALTTAGLSYRCIALKFEIHKSMVQKIAQGQRRCQTPREW